LAGFSLESIKIDQRKKLLIRHTIKKTDICTIERILGRSSLLTGNLRSSSKLPELQNK
jgi:hypothetical protein